MDISVEIPAWVQYAECGPRRRNIDPELFFPGQGEPLHPEVIDACAACPVIQECLEWAGEHGIWGGFTPNGRTRLAHGLPTEPIFSIKAIMARRRAA